MKLYNIKLNKILYSLVQVCKLKEYTTGIQVYHLLIHTTKNIFIDISNEILRRMGLKGPIVHNIIESKEDLVYQFQKYPGKTSGPALCLL